MNLARRKSRYRREIAVGEKTGLWKNSDAKGCTAQLGELSLANRSEAATGFRKATSAIALAVSTLASRFSCGERSMLVDSDATHI